ncbi:hypothetical protein ACOQFO_17260 [Ureibacillus sp. MALMAid1270]|uniref:hypothetical protein n=1 Tax=Ureibacillus sp. MALMAid1270 TaxID=3411629 RepID=UPI003BA6455C
MNFTSLNPVQSQQANLAQNQPLTLKQGQVLHGTIKKLYPDQIAEVQVGGHKFLAKLETPLKAGDSHFFQVKNISPQAELKVVSGPMDGSSTMTQQVQQLLDSMNLPKTSDMQQILAHLIKEQLPVSKELLIQAQELLSNNGGITKETLAALQKLIEMKMPISKDVFQAILQGSKTNGFSQILETFSEILLKDPSVAEHTKTTIMQNLERIAKPFDSQLGGIILSRAIQTISSESEPITNKLYALNLLKESGILSKQTILSNWQDTVLSQNRNTPSTSSNQLAGQIIQTVKTMNEGNTVNTLNLVKSWLDQESNLNQSQKNDILTLLNRFESLPKQSQNVEHFAKQLNELLLKSYSNTITNQPSNHYNALTHLLSLISPDAIPDESLLLTNLGKMANGSTTPQVQQMVQEAEQQIKSSLDGQMIQSAMKSVLKSLGLSYESTLNQKIVDFDQISNSLKPQVLSIIQDSSTSQPLKEAGEILLARMNGLQLLSGENGHQHQIVMQMPLQFLGRSMDATLQWNGRMKENGKIDSNYARILFYLDMQSLKETVVDMQVQNRIVTITLFNENENLQTVADPLQKLLKNNLVEKNYKLSGIFFKTFENNRTDLVSKTLKKEKNEDVARFSGVDIRI